MSRAEQLAMENGTSSLILMENAGNGVAEEVVKRFARGTKIVVLCGPGRNGGDGFVAARRLRERGYHIRLALLGDQDKLPPESKEMAKRWDEAIEPMTPDCLDGAQVIVDAIFGSGLKDDVRDIPAKMIEDVSRRNLPVVAIDIPTGIDATTGQVRGAAFKAVSTVSFYRRKTGQVLFPGRTYCGDVATVDIGIPASVMKEVGPRAFSDQPELWLKYYPRLKLTGHKYDRGHAVIVSGEMERTGAARLGARAALRQAFSITVIVADRRGMGLCSVLGPFDIGPVAGADDDAGAGTVADDIDALGRRAPRQQRHQVLVAVGSVQLACGARQDELTSARHRGGDTHRHRERVGGATGNHRQGNAGAQHLTGDEGNGAVAPGGDDQVGLRRDRLLRQLIRIDLTAGEMNV